MSYLRFAAYNVVGAFAWISIFLALGYFFGGIPMIQKNFTYVLFGIIAISLLPPIIELIRNKVRKAPASTIK